MFRYAIIFPGLLVLLVIDESLSQETIEERLLEAQVESAEQSELIEIILELKQNPIDINVASQRELKRIPGLPVNLPAKIVDHRKKHGPFQSKEDLLRVPGVTPELYEVVSELIHVPGQIQHGAQRANFEWRTRVTDRIEQSRGFKDGIYESTSQKLYNRIRFQFRSRFRGALLLEKDNGESRLDDLRLFYMSLDISPHVSVLVGNYQLETGQGLVLWGPYGFSKGADAIFPTRKNARGVRGYTSVDENAAFLGAAVAVRLQQVDLNAFISRNKLDATPRLEDEISGFFTSGFHRNELERQKKDVVAESVIGGKMSWQITQTLSIGLASYYTFFDRQITENDFVRNRFELRGDKNFVAGLNWEWTLPDAALFGELARSKSGGRALIVGTQWALHPLQLAFSYRDYQKDFQNTHGFGFANRSGATQNERGYYSGMHYKITPHTTFAAFVDIFHTPWRSFFEPVPTEGREFLTQLEKRLGRRVKLAVRFRDKTTQETDAFRDARNRTKQELIEIRRTQWRAQFDYTLSSSIRLRNRVEFVRFRPKRYVSSGDQKAESGLALYQNLRLKPRENVQVHGRLTFFDTRSFNSRLFQYENDLPGLVTNRALFGRGSRWYLMIRYAPNRSVLFSAKYSETFRDDVDTIGSGPDQIDSN
ncbi:helix-hairpin-helix domain-containing protein, partial [bacterium]|nr:helix-hairpin-helix domain-containing protein [bacterium]